MKKILLLLLAITASFQGIAQDPQLYRTWYLYEVQSSDLNPIYIVSEIDPPIQPFITISETLEFNGEGACNTFSGSYSYPSNDTLEFIDFTSTNDDCNNQIHNSFETDYFDFMHQFWFNISEDSNGLTLILDNGIFGYAIFKDYQLSSNDENFQNIVKVFPNPTAETLFITCASAGASGGTRAENFQITSYAIYSVQGKKVLSELENVSQIDVSTLSEGLYFLEITSEEGKSIQKFIKK